MTPDLTLVAPERPLVVGVVVVVAADVVVDVTLGGARHAHRVHRSRFRVLPLQQHPSRMTTASDAHQPARPADPERPRLGAAERVGQHQQRPLATVGDDRDDGVVDAADGDGVRGSAGGGRAGGEGKTSVAARAKTELEVRGPLDRDGKVAGGGGGVGGGRVGGRRLLDDEVVVCDGRKEGDEKRNEKRGPFLIASRTCTLSSYSYQVI